MKLSNIRHSRSGFTIVELVIAMTIFAIMSTMTILIYFNVSENARRLQIARELQESAREITERISQDVRSKWVFTGNIPVETPDLKYIINDNDFKSANPTHSPWSNVNNYSSDGWEILGIWNIQSPPVIAWTQKQIIIKAERYYVFWQPININDLTVGIKPCVAMDWSKNTSYCSLYLTTYDTTGNPTYYNLADSFRANDADKRVKITDLKFYISGGPQDANKVTLKMTLELMPRGWVPQSLIKSTKLEIQTTFSERAYKIN